MSAAAQTPHAHPSTSDQCVPRVPEQRPLQDVQDRADTQNVPTPPQAAEPGLSQDLALGIFMPLQEARGCISSRMLAVLRRASFESLHSVLQLSRIDLQKRTGLSAADVDTLVREVSQYVVGRHRFGGHRHLAIPTTTVADLHATQSYVGTGDAGLNYFLRGGVPRGAGITEVVGASGVGKTQFCLQLALMAIAPVALGGCGGSALYFSCDSAFPLRRFIEMSVAYESRQSRARASLNLDPVAPLIPLEKLFISHLFSLDVQHHVLQFHLPHFLSANPDVRLIVLDSITANIRVEMRDLASVSSRDAKGGNADDGISLRDRARMLAELVARLNYLAHKFNLAVVVVNQVSNMFSGDTGPSGSTGSINSAMSDTASHDPLATASRQSRVGNLYGGGAPGDAPSGAAAGSAPTEDIHALAARARRLKQDALHLLLEQQAHAQASVPALGPSWTNLVTTRLLFERLRVDTCISWDGSGVPHRGSIGITTNKLGLHRRRMRALFAPHIPPDATVEFVVEERGIKSQS